MVALHAFLGSVNALVMGRNRYETMQNFGPVFARSNMSSADFSPRRRSGIIRWMYAK